MADSAAAPALLLGPTFGMWLVSIYLESILYGMGILQVFLYFNWYPKDVWTIKAAVILLVIVETTQLALFYRSANFHLADQFGNAVELLTIVWSDYIQLMMLYLSAVIVQFYFTYCIYKFIGMSSAKKGIKFIVVIVVVLILLELGAGIAQVIQIFQLGSFVNLSSAKTMTSLQSAAALAIDLTITASLVIILDKNRTTVSKTNSMLNTLIIYAINRGVLTAACALINLILFLALPGTFYFFIGLVSSSKCTYMNSMLATLNARSYIRSKGDQVNDHGGVNWNSMLNSTMNQNQGKTPIAVYTRHHVTSDANRNTAVELRTVSRDNLKSLGEESDVTMTVNKGELLA